MDDFLCGVVTGIVLGIILLGVIVNIAGTTYEDGQIDALTGNVKYHLVINPDSTKTWESIK
jgi:hypothetical protein